MNKYAMLIVAGFTALLLGCSGGNGENAGANGESPNTAAAGSGESAQPIEPTYTIPELVARADEARKKFETDLTNTPADQRTPERYNELQRDYSDTVKSIAKSLQAMIDRADGDDKLEPIAALFRLQSPGSGTMKAMRLLDEFVESDQLQPVLESLVDAGPRTKARFLQDVIDQNPHAEIQAMAKAVMAKTINHKSPTKAEAFAKEIRDQHADVEFNEGTLLDVVRAPLFAMEHLRVGKTAANITAPDTDGEVFSLEDYRGKIVMLDFWGDW